MFWRFGFHNASAIDNLLDKEDVSLEAILDEDELLQECKAQNTRLIDYFQRVDVLQRLLGYVTGQIEGEERGRFKYPYVATEVLCSEIWSIVETCLNHSEQLLTPFWETVLDRSPEDMKTQMVMATHFAKINAMFLSKKPAEMMAFIQNQPDVVDRFLHHIETPSFADLLIRIIQLDELPAGAGVLEWLSRENLMKKLVGLLSPHSSPDMHTVVAELIKGIISMAAPSPAAGLSGADNGPASNQFARELARRDSVETLVGYILSEPPPPGPPQDQEYTKEGEEAKDDVPKDTDKGKAREEASDSLALALDPSLSLPNAESTVSSIVQSICIIIELIRQNNSDYFEPYLFHTLRNRLIHVQQQLQMHTQDGREALERAMKEMVNRMGVVHLGPVLDIICEKLEELQKYLLKPRSINGPVLTTVGALTPLTFERYRLCELYAELLHCSNMSLLNRSPEFDHLYDSEGRLQGGLSSLEELAQVIASGSGNERDHDGMDDDNDEIEHAHDFPISSASHDTGSLMDSDEDMSGDDEPGSSDDDAMEEIAMYDEPQPLAAPLISQSPTSTLSDAPFSSSLGPPSGSPVLTVTVSPSSSPPVGPIDTSDAVLAMAKRRQSTGSDSEGSTARPRSASSRRSTKRASMMENLGGRLVLGERLKKRFLEVNVASTLLDLFFEFPWNNFLHSVVYDLIHQVLTGRHDPGYNRELTISLFRDARLMHRIIEGSKRNDIESSKPKGVRLGYMGHLTLISEDVIGALEHFPPDLRLTIAQYSPQPEWDEYVTGRYKETKKKDTSLLGGGKPVIASGMRNGGVANTWKVDEAEAGSGSAAGVATTAVGSLKEKGEAGGSEANGEMRRGARNAREASTDFGAPMDDDDDDEFHSAPPHEMQSSDHFSSDDASSDEEEDGGWLAQSHFDLRPPPVSARQHNGNRRPLSSSTFDDSFEPPTASANTGFTDPFDDDAFGPFSDSAAASGSEPFTFPTGIADEMIEDSSFDSFGDFGDFQSASSLEDSGALTPTADSWSFASNSSAGSMEEFGGRLSGSPNERTAT